MYLSNQRGSAKGIPWTSMARVATFDNVTYDWSEDSHRKVIVVRGFFIEVMMVWYGFHFSWLGWVSLNSREFTVVFEDKTLGNKS